MRIGIAVILALCLHLPLHAQSEPKLTFDVASIRENKSGPPPAGEESNTNVPLGPGNVYSPTNGQFNAKNLPLMTYISFAYRMSYSQQQEFAATVPHWVEEERFNIQARTDKTDVTKDELRLMMRTLLADRFSLAVHYETRTANVLAVELVKPGATGTGLRPHPGGLCSRDFRATDAVTALGQAETMKDGYPTVCGGLVMLPTSTGTHFVIGARDMSIDLIASSLSSWGELGRPTVNATGLTGNYDFHLEFVPKRPDPPPGTPVPTDLEEPNFLESVRKQLGFKFESQKRPVQVLVLDHIDYLSEN